ncbi:MAG: hypothetical protein ACLR0N_16595 [Bilophila wadsworthia]
MNTRRGDVTRLRAICGAAAFPGIGRACRRCARRSHLLQLLQVLPRNVP